MLTLHSLENVVGGNEQLVCVPVREDDVGTGELSLLGLGVVMGDYYFKNNQLHIDYFSQNNRLIDYFPDHLVEIYKTKHAIYFNEKNTRIFSLCICSYVNEWIFITLALQEMFQILKWSMDCPQMYWLKNLSWKR